jgi:uncharacterized membrane protein YdjX (TVP38/TMEM64 family)
MKWFRFALFIILGTALLLFFILDLDLFFSFDYIKSRQSAFELYYTQHPVETMLLFFVVYVLSAALSFPGATILSILGGILFGLLWGTIIVSLASTVGATLAFLSARFLFRDYVQNTFSKWMEPVNKGMHEQGGFYLLSLRLAPLIPYVVVNLLMGLTSISIFRYFWVSQLGMLPGTMVYVNAGVQLAQMEAVEDIFSPELLLAFLLLALFPFISKKALAAMQKFMVQ